MAGMRIVGLGRDSENAGKEEEKVGTSHIGNIDNERRTSSPQMAASQARTTSQRRGAVQHCSQGGK